MNKADPPDFVGMPDPDGPVRWAEVYHHGLLVGAVWMAEHSAARPRAGIILVRERDPDMLLQHDVGGVAFAMLDDSAMDATEWLDHLAETRTGNSGKLAVGGARDAASVGEVYAAVGLDPFLDGR